MNALPVLRARHVPERERGDRLLTAIEIAIGLGLARHSRGPFVLGVCGAQGSGKSTLSAALARRLGATGIKTSILSIDDLYMTAQAREALAREVHPALRTRGVPGTHDIALGLAAIDALERGCSATLPRFDKARDDRMPESSWETVPPDCAVLILEGWCVGATPQTAAALETPTNPFERLEDPDGVWRTYANRSLGGDYQRLFDRIDFLVLLAAPRFEIVQAWRLQQEHELRARVGPGASSVMSDAEIVRFIQLFERLTRHILDAMPDRADMVVPLDDIRSPQRIRFRSGDLPPRASEKRHSEIESGQRPQ